ncbi:NADPH-dependent FMN reductase family protein [Anaerocolumna xylanovorans]|uniref:Multimeric flavodoxin WrbA n=1 Tax=Anaerocolumna xylanovorans DSM 12503 TaxID=1121345 RepID=A0A1M7Y8B2_9FIRM|nr:hypothetical protein [Anaerocolumna xylanovorans]SHO48873.1 hypothetical protein SAMN02745217_02072 [Anaerocolumna xylanovorans DSM 12503]
MKIAIIDGSPKSKDSASSFFIKKLEPMISSENEISHYNISKKPLVSEQYQELCRMDALIFAFPLYIDAIPSHLFRMLATLEEYIKKECQKTIYVYAIINNGFYEGKQNHIAIKILQNWCMRTGLQFGQAIGQGAGEMMHFVEKVPLGHGPLKNLGENLNHLADTINSHNTGATIVFSPNFPRFAWKFNAVHFFWNQSAKKNGLRKKDILRRL